MHPLDTGARTIITPTASNGTTAVPLVAAVANQVVYPGTLFVTNPSATAHTILFLSNSTVIGEVYSPATCTVFVDGRGGRFETNAGESFGFKIDAGGAGTDVRVSGSAVQK